MKTQNQGKHRRFDPRFVLHTMYFLLRVCVCRLAGFRRKQMEKSKDIRAALVKYIIMKYLIIFFTNQNKTIHKMH